MQSVPVPVPLRSTMITTKKWKQTLFQSVRSNCNAVLTRASSLSSVSTPNTLTIDRFLRRSSLQTISHSIESANSINEFEILCILGSGTFGTVKLARHRPTNHPVAIKCLSKEDVVEMRQEMNLLREQHIHLSLCHPCISRMYTTFQDPTTVYFVLEYIPGGELYRVIYTTNNTDKQHDEIEPQQEDSTDCESDDEIREEEKRLLERQRSSSSLNHQATHLLRSGWFYGGLHPSHVAFYLGCLVSAMDYLHTQSIVYRDLKLENIVLDAMGYPKLIDFGLSKIVQTNIEICTTICGSMEYMAPEVLKRQGYTIKADLWSFGILMYELLFGTTPFHDTNTQEQTKRILEEEIIISTVFRKEYPEASNLLKLLLAKNPHDRPNSFHSLRTHAFFKEYFPSIKAWKQLETRKIQAPFIPVLENAFDASLFPHACLEEEDDDEEEED